MLFNSVEFLLLFLPVVLLIYYRLGHKAQNVFLVIASCVFYASWDWRFLFPLLATTSIDYWVSRRIESGSLRTGEANQRKRYLAFSIIANLSLLGFFKYYNFFVDSFVDLAALFHLELSRPTLEIVLPLAISFYTFQAMSYTIDVYRGQLHATRSFWDFFLAILYFPHLVAGPIQRAANLIPQVTNPRTITRAQVTEGLHLIIWGFFKKVFIADNLAPIVDAAFSQSGPTGGVTLLGVYAFTFQIYCDFSGYTDIARGLAKIMGFEFVLNFRLPYFATNPSDFWRRWHISLSTWLRDYLYISLGGNRHGESRTRRNLMITMLLGGLWHGAAWNFVLWGFYHGALLVVHRMATTALGRADSAFSRTPHTWLMIRIAAMFLFTCYGWLLFRATSLEQVVQMTASLLNPLDGIDPGKFRLVTTLIAPLLLIELLQFRTGQLDFSQVPWIPRTLKVIAYSAMVYLMLFAGGAPQEFVYFQF